MKKVWRHYSHVLNEVIKGITFSSLCLLGFHFQPAYADSNPDFWLAEKGTQKIWLLGSIHVGTESMYPLPENIANAWKQSDQLILETDISDTDNSWMQLAILPDNSSLPQKLSVEEYQRLNQISQTLHISIKQLERFQPWFIALMLQQEAIRQSGYKASLGIDHHFQTQAIENNKPTYYLETPKQQIEFLANMGNIQSDFLDATLNQIDEIDTELPTLVKAWEAGDNKTIERLLEDDETSKSLKDYLQNTLLTQRNHNWVEQLMKLEPNNNFMVVGAMHLYGTEGLLRLLKQNGYQMTHLHISAN